MARVALILLAASLWAGLARAAEIPDAELNRAPTPERVAALQTEAAVAGWPAVAAELHRAALGLYKKKGTQAQAWYYLYRWAMLFGQTEREAIERWSHAIEEAPINRANMPKAFVGSEHPLADFAPPELRAYMMESFDFSNQFFTMLTPLDRTPAVFFILGLLWTHNPVEFREYANLALAIAIVDDVPPPPDWPHGQVNAQVLPRKLPAPLDLFIFLTESSRKGALLQPLAKLPASELKFVVDTVAGFQEMLWAQQKVHVELPELGKIYDHVRYRRDRFDNRIYQWPKPSYQLPDILAEGGICVDQAYFASMIGKAKGVPTLLFRGFGLDGTHAWFGYLDGGGHWQLDCGRYADQKFMVGYAFDPQTWMNISDHELQFLSEGFRRQPLYTASITHMQFADLFFFDGDFPGAAKAARAAVDIERRNLEAWFILVAALQRMGSPPQQVEGSLQEASIAFLKYPDVDAEFKRRLARNLRARGETSQADFIERGMAHKYEGSREDVTANEAWSILRRSMENDDVAACTRTYTGVLKSFGSGTGMDFFARVVRPFVEYLLKKDQPREALQAVERARAAMRVQPKSQLEQEFHALEDRIHQALH
jgi:hypothetical protein